MIEFSEIDCRSSLRSKERRGKAFFRRYDRFFAEFLYHDSLAHLGLLDPPTGVGLRYGYGTRDLPPFLVSASLLD